MPATAPLPMASRTVSPLGSAAHEARVSAASASVNGLSTDAGRMRTGLMRNRGDFAVDEEHIVAAIVPGLARFALLRFFVRVSPRQHDLVRPHTDADLTLHDQIGVVFAVLAREKRTTLCYVLRALRLLNRSLLRLCLLFLRLLDRLLTLRDVRRDARVGCQHTLL